MTLNKVLNNQVSFYLSKEEQGAGKPIPVYKLLFLIKDLEHYNPKLFSTIKDIRTLSCLHSDPNYKREAKKLKDTLPCVTFAGKFNTKTRNGLEVPSNIIVADIDDVYLDIYVKATKELKEDKHILFFFLSPSGKGLKIGINIPFTDELSYSEAMLETNIYLKNNYGLTVDPSTFNINRLCYLSYDEELYLNEEAEELPVSENTKTEVANQRKAKSVKFNPYVTCNNVGYLRNSPIVRDNFNRILNYWLNLIANTIHPGRHAVLYNAAARLGNFSWFITSQEGLEQIKELFIETYLNNHNGPCKERKEAERTFEDGFNFGNQPERQQSLL